MSIWVHGDVNRANSNHEVAKVPFFSLTINYETPFIIFKAYLTGTENENLDEPQWSGTEQPVVIHQRTSSTLLGAVCWKKWTEG